MLAEVLVDNKGAGFYRLVFELASALFQSAYGSFLVRKSEEHLLLLALGLGLEFALSKEAEPLGCCSSEPRCSCASEGVRLTAKEVFSVKWNYSLGALNSSDIII
jgi:hypothetical protein